MICSIKYLFAFLCVTMVAVAAIRNSGSAHAGCSEEWQRAVSTDHGDVFINEPTLGFDRKLEPVCLDKADVVESKDAYEPDMLLPRLFFWL